MTKVVNDQRLKGLALAVTSLTIAHYSHHLLLCLNSVYCSTHCVSMGRVASSKIVPKWIRCLIWESYRDADVPMQFP